MFFLNKSIIFSNYTIIIWINYIYTIKIFLRITEILQQSFTLFSWFYVFERKYTCESDPILAELVLVVSLVTRINSIIVLPRINQKSIY